MSQFRIGRLDHVHLRVPDRAAAAAWYAEHLGMEPVEKYDFWANGFDGGPLQISADGGRTMLALFEATDSHPMEPQRTGVAFSVAGAEFIAFARSLPGELQAMDGEALTVGHVVDFDLCWAFEFCDPWGNRFELNSYDYDQVRAALVDDDGAQPQRYWPSELYADYRRLPHRR